MKTKNTMMVMAGLLTSMVAFAQGSGREGHGGKVWVCKRPGEPTTYQLNEFYRAKPYWGLTIDQGPGKTAAEMMEYVYKNLDAIDPWRAKDLRERTKTFLSRTVPIDDTSFFGMEEGKPGAIRDTIEPSSREFCQLIPMVNQLNEMPDAFQSNFRNHDIRFWLYQKYWNLDGKTPEFELPADTKAGLIPHELIYEDALEFGHKDAEATLEINAWIHSKEIRNLDRRGWLEMTQYKKMPYWFHNGKFRMTEFWKPEGAEKPDLLLPKRGFLVADAEILGYQIKKGALVEFNIEGQMTSASKLEENLIQTPVGAITVRGGGRFHPNGTIAAAGTAHGKIKLNGQEVDVKGPVTFHENGGLKDFELLAREKELSDGNKVIVYPILSFAGETGIEVKGGRLREDGTVSQIQLVGTHEFRTRAGKLKLSGLVRIRRTGWDSPLGLVSGEVSLNQSGVLIWLDAKVRLKDGSRKRNVEDGYPIYFDGAGKFLSGAAIVPGAKDRGDHYIRVVREGDLVGLRQCRLDEPEACQVIGAREFYSDSEIKQLLKVKKYENTYKGMNGTETVLFYLGMGAGTTFLIFPGLVTSGDVIFTGGTSLLGTGVGMLPGVFLHEIPARSGPRSVARRLLRKKDFQAISVGSVDQIITVFNKDLK